MAHKKAGGSSRNGRDSESKRLGSKNIWRSVCKSWWNYLKAARNKNAPRRKCWAW